MGIKLIIVDDHRIFRSGIRSLLEEEDAIDVLGEAEDMSGLLRSLEENEADIVLMDINLKESSGVRATERLSQEFPDVKVLGLTMHEEGETIEAMMDAGAMGYIFKDAEEDELQEGIWKVSQGERFFSNAASERLIEHLRNKERSAFKGSRSLELTEREIHILHLIALEHTNSEIAKDLVISPKTVDGHRRKLLQKFDVRNSAGLIRVAMEGGYISSNSLDRGGGHFA